MTVKSFQFLPIILMLWILTVCPAQTIFRLFAQFICARKEKLHYFQLPLPLPEFEFATVNVKLDVSIQSSGNAFTENYLLRKQNLSLCAFLVGCFMLIFHKICISFIKLKLQTYFKWICSLTQFSFCNFTGLWFFLYFLSNYKHKIKPSSTG